MIKIKIKNIITVLVIVFVLILINVFGIFKSLEDTVSLASISVMRPFYVFGFNISQGWQRLMGSDELSQEVSNLRSQLASIQFDLVEMRVLQGENENLRALVGYRKQVNDGLVSARLIAQRDLNRQIIMILDKGLSAGLASHDMVVDEYGRVLGRLSEVKEEISFLQLLTDPEFEMAAQLSGEGTVGTISGDLSIGLRLNLIPIESLLKLGDIVVSKQIPYAPIGIVREINLGDGELFKSAHLEPLVQVDKVIYVSVISGQK